MRTSAIIAAGGSGIRMNNPDGKLFIEICGKPIIWLTVSKFEKSDVIDEIIIAVSPDDIGRAKELFKQSSFKKTIKIIAGGKTRQDSVFNGLKELSNDTDIVVVHDGARPFVSEEIILEAVSEARARKAVIVGVPVKDTIKIVNDDRIVSNTLERELLWQVQTPQAFEYSLIKEAHDKAEKLGIKATDDAGLVERLGEKVKMIMGSYDNIKITTPEDLKIAEAILRLKQ